MACNGCAFYSSNTEQVDFVSSNQAISKELLAADQQPM
jgi:hypothetical protein